VFIKGRVTNDHQIHEEVFDLLVIKEMQIKTTPRLHLTPVRIAIIKGNSNNKFWEGCGKQEPLYTVGGGAN
jgi:hypothetical protein